MIISKAPYRFTLEGCVVFVSCSSCVAEFFVSEMRNSEKVILENDGDDDALDVIVQGLLLQPYT